MSNTTAGRCLCGAVHFEAAGEPLFSSNCHCRDCQRASGSAYMPLMAFPNDVVRVTGEVRYFKRQGDSGATASEGFCPQCGARLFARADALAGILLIHAGSLDDPTQYKPQLDIYTSSAQPWDRMDPDLPKHSKMPPLGK